MATRPNIGIFGGPPKASSGSIGGIFGGALKSAASSTPQTTVKTTAPVVSTAPASTPANTAFTYQKAVEFMNGPIGSQIPYIARVLRPSNWNNLNSGLKAKYLGEVQRAINDPVGFSLERLKEDVAGYVVYQNIPGGGGTAKAEAKDLKANIDKYVSFLQSQGRSVNDITSAIDKGYSAGVISLEEQVGRMNEYPVIDRVADVALNVGLGALSSGLSTGAQIALNSAIAYEQGAKPEDIVRGAVGSLLANQIGPLGVNGGPITTGVSVVDDFNKAIQAIENPELQSAIFNAARQGVYATVTEQDIAKNMAAGAVAGAVATNIQNKYKDPSLANAAGEYLQAKIAGKSDLEAAAAAFSGYATEEEKKSAQRKVAEEVSALPLDQVQALGYKTKDEITGAFFPVPPEIAAKQQFKTMPGEVGENIIQVTDKDGIVTYEKKVTAQTPLGNKIDYTILYDTDTNQFYYEYGTGEKKVLSKSRPSLTTLNASQEILPSSLVGAQTGQRKQGDDFGVSTVQTPLQVDVYGGQSVEEMPTISLLRTVRTGQKPLQVDVYGGAGFDRGGELTPQESVAQREPEEEEPEKQRLITESAEEAQQEEPEAQRPTNSTVLLGLLGGTGTKDFARMVRTQRAPSEREAANMQALSQALSVGDPGDALFGSGLGRRRNVWNVESLRLKDELGG